MLWRSNDVGPALGESNNNIEVRDLGNDGFTAIWLNEKQTPTFGLWGMMISYGYSASTTSFYVLEEREGYENIITGRTM